MPKGARAGPSLGADTFFTLADGESAREPGLRFGGDSGLERLASNWWPRRSLIHEIREVILRRRQFGELDVACC